MSIRHGAFVVRLDASVLGRLGTLVDMSQQAVSYKMALASIASDERYSEILRHGRLSAGIYAPHESDEQESHPEDRIYVVLNGSGFFTVDGDRQPFGPSDLLFAAADVSHQFENFTPDFAVWAISCSSSPGGN